MLLVFDVGNSETTVGLFDEARLVGHWRLPTLSQRSVMETRAWLMHTLHHAALAASDVTAVAIASVVPAAVEPIVQSCELAFGQAPLLVTAHSALPLEVAVEQPSAVGIDRLLNTLAAHQLFGVDAICVDAGTATTLDCVTGTGVFLGGVIMPGVLTAATSLLANTAQLLLSQPPRRPDMRWAQTRPTVCVPASGLERRRLSMASCADSCRSGQDRVHRW